MSRPWMPLYIADYRADTARLSTLEHGAYLLLIMEYWRGGGLPSDDRQLARITCMTDREWKKVKPTIESFFQPGWKHKRIDEELAHCAEVSSKRSAAAKGRKNKSDANDGAIAEAIDDANAGASDGALAHTLHTSPKGSKEDTAPSGAFVFESGVIRLTQKHFDEWTLAFPNLELRAELLSLTEWAGGQKKWFFAVSSALAKRNREIGLRLKSPAPKVLSPFGTPYPEGII